MKYFYLLILGIIIIISGCSNDDYSLAKVGDFLIYKSQFIRVFPGVKGETDYNKFKEAAENNFERMLKQWTLMYQEKENIGEKEALKVYNNMLNRYLIQAVYNDFVTKKIHLSDKEVFEKYKRLKTTVWAQHIMVNDKKLIDSLYIVLKNNPEKFDTLAKQFSEDKMTKDNGGRLRPFAGDKFVKSFEDVAMTAPIGVINKPIKTPFGWHIILVNNRAYKTLDNFDKDKLSLKKKMLKKITQKRIEESAEELKQLGQIKIDTTNIELLEKYIKDNELTANNLDQLPQEAKQLKLATSIFGVWTIDSVLKYADYYEFGRVPGITKDAISSFIDRELFFMTIYDRGRRMGVGFNNDIKKEVTQKLAITTEQNISNKIAGSLEMNDSILKVYYDNHPEEFSREGYVGIYIICDPDSQKIAMIMDSLKLNKKPFREYSRLYSTIKPKEFQKPSYYIKTEDNKDGYYKKAMELGKVNAISDIFKNANGYNIIKVVEIKEPQIREFETVKNIIRENYRKFVIDSTINHRYEEAKKQGLIKVYEDRFEEVVKELFNKEQGE